MIGVSDGHALAASRRIRGSASRGAIPRPEPFTLFSSLSGSWDEQIVRNLLLSKWSDTLAVEIEPRSLKQWFLCFDIESSTRDEYRSIMSGVYTWGQCEV
jgi:hypothetical protein